MSPKLTCKTSKSKTFTLFPHLPPELRIQIWESSIPSRIISLAQYRLSPTSSTRNSVGYRSRSPPPALLSTCHESRSVALKIYTKAFPGNSTDAPAATWFDFERDTLYLPLGFVFRDRDGYAPPGPDGPPSGRQCINRCFFNELCSDVRKVQCLALGGAWEPGSDRPWTMIVQRPLGFLLEAFENLEVVTLVDAQHAEGEGDLVEALEWSPYGSEEVHDKMEKEEEYQRLMRYDEYMYYDVYHEDITPLKWLPWFEFRTYIARAKKEGEYGKGRSWSFSSWKRLFKRGIS